MPAWADIPDTSSSLEEEAEYHDVQQHIHQAIQALPSQFRPVVLLCYVAQLSYTEIGQMLNMAEATARLYFRRVKPLLRAA
jgi:RNA polymerase sigma factor (sigma-70 family)